MIQLQKLIHLFSRLNFSVNGLKLRPLNVSSYDRYFSEHHDLDLLIAGSDLTYAR